jgi:hypothetical protein
MQLRGPAAVAAPGSARQAVGELHWRSAKESGKQARIYDDHNQDCVRKSSVMIGRGSVLPFPAAFLMIR